MNTLEIITLALVVALGGFMLVGITALILDTSAEIIRDRKRNKQWKQARKVN